MNLFNFFSLDTPNASVSQKVHEKLKNTLLQTGITLFSNAWFELHQHFKMTERDYIEILQNENHLTNMTSESGDLIHGRAYYIEIMMNRKNSV